MHARKRLFFSALLFAAFPAQAGAAIVYLKDGRSISGRWGWRF